MVNVLDVHYFCVYFNHVYYIRMDRIILIFGYVV